jgi:adenylosuccinate lyase
MSATPIDALSPFDGRYAGKLASVRGVFSEAGLMRERVRVECAWLLALASGPAAAALAQLPPRPAAGSPRSPKDPAAPMSPPSRIEARTNHDVKAVEYWIRAQLTLRGAAPAQLEWVHFGCTSEDINNLAYALMLKAGRGRIMLPALDRIGALLDALAHRHAAVGMLARTHGQTATPTTVGKELANVAARLHMQRSAIDVAVEILRQDERRSRQFQRARGGAARHRLAGLQRGLRRVLGASAPTPTPRRSSRTIGSPNTVMR